MFSRALSKRLVSLKCKRKKFTRKTKRSPSNKGASPEKPPRHFMFNQTLTTATLVQFDACKYSGYFVHLGPLYKENQVIELG